MKRLFILFGIVVGLMAFAARKYEHATAPNFGWEPPSDLPTDVRQFLGEPDQSLKAQRPDLFPTE